MRSPNFDMESGLPESGVGGLRPEEAPISRLVAGIGLGKAKKKPRSLGGPGVFSTDVADRRHRKVFELYLEGRSRKRIAWPMGLLRSAGWGPWSLTRAFWVESVLIFDALGVVSWVSL